MTGLFTLARRSRLFDVIVFAAIVLGVLGILAVLPEPESLEVAGRARVIDGDSLVVQGVELRLDGIDAPESGQTCTRAGNPWPCGREAARRLAGRVAGRLVECKGGERDEHDRVLAVCRADGEEINRWLVAQGWAVSYHAYPGSEREARAAGRGIWSGEFARPRDWREENR